MKVSFIGLGKLGMPCAETIAKRGWNIVNGYDILEKKSKFVKIKKNLADAVKGSEIVFVATPTPHDNDYGGEKPVSHLEPKDFNYSSVIEVLKQCNNLMNKKQLLVLVSTVLPGTTRKHFAPLVTKTNFVYNPYLIAMGTVKEDFLNPEMIMIGTEKGGKSKQALKLTEFYKNVLGHEPRIEYCTWDECEAIKIFYNTFISTKIALVNMIQDVAVKNGNINVDNVTKALSASTNRIISQKYMTAGMGDGGSCHPRDNIALRWLSKRLNLNYDIFSAIIEAREMQAKNMATEILKHGKVIHFTSDSYKPGTTMTDGSYSLLVQHYIRELGGVVSYGFDQPIDVHVLVHPGDSVELSDGKGIIFDPWRKYPKGSNVIHYGDNDNV